MQLWMHKVTTVQYFFRETHQQPHKSQQLTLQTVQLTLVVYFELNYYQVGRFEDRLMGDDDDDDTEHRFRLRSVTYVRKGLIVVNMSGRHCL